MGKNNSGDKGKIIDILSTGPTFWQTYGKGLGSGPGAIGQITGRESQKGD